jgi:hypothetical protein
LLAEGRLVKEDLDADYRFLDPRLDRYYEWVIGTFAERNFSVSGTQNLLRLMLFESHLRLDDSKPNHTFREMVKCITALDNRIVLETLEEGLNYFESNPDAHYTDEVPQQLAQHHAKQDALIRRDLASLLGHDPANLERIHLTR